MTSVAVISSAVARINCLKDLPKILLPDESGKLQKGLQEIKGLLEAGGCKNAKLEREIVRLSYDIVDAIADVSSAARDKPRTAATKLQELQKKLNQYLQDLGLNKSESIAPQGSQVEAGPEKQQEHDKKDAISGPSPRSKSKSESTIASPKRKPKSTTAPLGSEVPPKQESKKRTSLSVFLGKLTKSESTTASAIQDEEKKPEKGTTEVQDGSEEKGGTEINLLNQVNKVQAGSEEKGATEVQAGSEEKGGTEIDLLQRLKESSSGVVYIMSESGMGKSTRAKNLFNKLKKDSAFNVCAWVPTSNKPLLPNKKDSPEPPA